MSSEKLWRVFFNDSTTRENTVYRTTKIEASEKASEQRSILVASATRLKMSLTSSPGRTKKFEFFHWLTKNGCAAALRIPFYFRPAHSRPQRLRSFWSAPRIATSGQVQRHSGFEWICKHNRLRPEPIRFVRHDSEYAQSDGKSLNRGLTSLDSARGRHSWCSPKGARPLGTRMGPAQRRLDTARNASWVNNPIRFSLRELLWRAG